MSFHWTLEEIYFVSQISIPILAIVAAFLASSQVNTFKLFELLKYIQDPEFRAARRIVIREIGPIQDQEWWTDDRLEHAASTCTAHYDVLGRTLIFGGSRGINKFFISEWADSILRTHDILSKFIARRRASGGNDYRGYEWLYRRCQQYRRAPRKK